MTEYSLVDIWRIRNKELSQFTWKGKGQAGLVQSRIDFWLISSSFEHEVDKCLIQQGLLSDHCILLLSLNLLQIQRRGRGTWKFNNNLLKDLEYIELIKKTIQQVQGHSDFFNKSTRWEYLKCQMRTEAMIFARAKVKTLKNEETELLNLITHLETNLDNSNKEEYYDIMILKLSGNTCSH